MHLRISTAEHLAGEMTSRHVHLCLRQGSARYEVGVNCGGECVEPVCASTERSFFVFRRLILLLILQKMDLSVFTKLVQTKKSN